MSDPLDLEGMTRGVTHWPNCHEHHWNCAIRYLESRLDVARSNLVKIHANADINGYGSSDADNPYGPLEAGDYSMMTEIEVRDFRKAFEGRMAGVRYASLALSLAKTDGRDDPTGEAHDILEAILDGEWDEHEVTP